jgi:small subunit ribosomal protein S17
MTDTATEVPTPSPASSPAVADDAPVRGLRKSRIGEVTANKMHKTVVVETISRVPHAKFGKIIKQVKKFYVHDEEGKAQVGDVVRISETRPLSKLKRWRLVEILKH